MRKGGCPSLGGLGKCFLWGEGSSLGLEKWVEFRAEKTGEEGGPGVDTAWAVAELRIDRRAYSEYNWDDAGGEECRLGLEGHMEIMKWTFDIQAEASKSGSWELRLVMLCEGRTMLWERSQEKKRSEM